MHYHYHYCGSWIRHQQWGRVVWSGVGDSETANDPDDSTDDFPPWNVVACRFSEQARNSQWRSIVTLSLRNQRPIKGKARCSVLARLTTAMVVVLKPVLILYKSLLYRLTTFVLIAHLHCLLITCWLTRYRFRHKILVTYWWQEKVTAFRVCVNARDHGRIKDASLWSKGIVIRIGFSDKMAAPTMANTNLKIATYNLHGMR